MELRLIIPSSPAPGRYAFDIETSYPTSSTLSSPRYRSKEVVSSISNPEYRTTTYDRLEITIKERTKPSRRHREHRSPSGNLIASKSTPNLRRALETVPRPPPPPPIQSARYERHGQQLFPYENSDASKTSSAFNSPWSNSSSSSVSDISPLTPNNGQIYFLPSFQERDAGLAIQFEPMEARSPAESFGPHTGFSNHTTVYELEDTSRRRTESPIDQRSPLSLLEKPLPLLPCPKSVEKKINRSEPNTPRHKLKETNPSNHKPELRSSSMRSERKPSMARQGPSPPYLSKSSAQSTHTTVSRAKDSRPSTSNSKAVSFRQLQPDNQVPHQQHQMEQNQGQRRKKQQKPAFSIHLGRLHLVFGSTKEELADSRRKAGMYSDFETSDKSYCQDSRGRIQHV
ncbi:hypothetical protein TWF106_005401 [Orbilia oligospora]|uniref:Uncharacterized protein n=1 Tax=Orbilia oligospora TaxID=2813651 RepID=A0A6G1LZ46_ORBOL|nr:hypothetical protein TWF788_006944 [Orbilia oligospora]KAF3196087.1 hypothetical protein TWF106_005401 [Orbilia oligospora]KAF3199454.1 hypothetical protein TWF191_004419 [Orbilia oligospora]KAF3218041.1 hypothetical protein TWF679_001455 [Orbilia oligospora]KAF3239217.1 hypothetical protein TWF192_010090 [Orbilia oligospora]